MDLSERAATALACCALDRQLGGILLFDLDDDLLIPLARWLSELLGNPAAPSVLGSGTVEDDLWERIHPEPAGHGFIWKTGPLAHHSGPARVVVVPDLARLSLPAARAAVTMIGADVFHLERHGRQEAWRPTDRWIASCRRVEVGRISPHLLDRFPVRISAVGLRPPGRANVLHNPPSRWRRAIQSGDLPSLSHEAAERSAEYIPRSAPGMRRELAVARLARAWAALSGAPVTQREHVDAAAQLIGLAGERDVAVHVPGSPAGQDSTAGPALPPDAGSGAQEVALPGDEPHVLAAAPIASAVSSSGPYPEDHADPQHETEPLRAGFQRDFSSEARGHPIGTQTARDIRDIAVTATLLESAKFQALRCEQQIHSEHAHSLHLSAADLRSHRRVRDANHLLVLVLDHTCQRGRWDWYAPLAPYLQWAYARRASVGVVEVGAAAAAHELRAEHFRSRNLLDPRVANALEREPGRATPLAHGLSLATQLLRHDTQQGSASVSQALLVVVTDGRGNVPLTASHARLIPRRVAAEGVADALQVARLIRAMRRVSSLVIEPGPLPYGHLATMLAEALGAPLIPGLGSGARHGG